MIQLTRLNGNPLFVNCDLIKWAEAAPDTMLTLVNGEKVVVQEPCSEVLARMVGQRVQLLAELLRFMPDLAGLMRGVSVASIPSGVSEAWATAPSNRSFDETAELK